MSMLIHESDGNALVEPRRRGARLGVVGTAFASIAAVVALAAPHATAAVTSLYVAPPMGGRYGVGCSYTVTATVTSFLPVEFRDNGRVIPGSPRAPFGNTATVQWYPMYRGSHLIQALQFPGYPRSQWIQVTGTGVNTGTSCIVLPF
ncbi:MAG: hypothetical protein HOQ24_17540 [Mycobacteriaceae bacterium]|nr:hypothetical protein [Mycobacteriaceae bacterium]